jgi:hypothetical protein
VFVRRTPALAPGPSVETIRQVKILKIRAYAVSTLLERHDISSKTTWLQETDRFSFVYLVPFVVRLFPVGTEKSRFFPVTFSPPPATYI